MFCLITRSRTDSIVFFSPVASQRNRFLYKNAFLSRQCPTITKKHSQQSVQSPVRDNPAIVFHPTVFSHHIQTVNYIFPPFSNASDIEILFCYNILGSFPATFVFPCHHICKRHKACNTVRYLSGKRKMQAVVSIWDCNLIST